LGEKNGTLITFIAFIGGMLLNRIICYFSGFIAGKENRQKG
jgi:hypothetical protein